MKKNHVSNECTGSEFRSGVIPALCERGRNSFFGD
ncbi:Uncharacterised protein [Raoultella terrigena]|nr:Uncharacterised protein [Raoultella terrigena]